MNDAEIPDYPELHKRDASITAAHSSLCEAIKHLDRATTHGDELDRLWIAGIMRQLCDARRPLAEHCDLAL
jgi:hypothetical protein